MTIDTSSALDFCPKHNNPVKKQYDFGKFHDASVTVYQGCNCASSFANNGFNDPAVCHKSYALASGRAKMICRQAAVW